MPSWSGAAVTPDGGPSQGLAERFPAEAGSRIPLAVAGIGAAFVLQSSWATLRSPFDAGLALLIVVGLVHGVLGWVPWLRLPARPGPTSFVIHGVVLALYLLLTPQRLDGDPASLLWTRLACGLVVAVVAHHAFDGARGLPTWREVAILALLPGLVGAGVLAVHGRPGAQPASGVTLAVGAEVAGGVADALTFPTEGPTAVPPTTEAPAPAASGATTTPARAGGAAAPTAPTAARGTATTAAPASTTTTAAPVRAVKLLISGESTAGATGGGIRAWGQKNKRAEVEVVGSNACALQQDGVAVLRDGWTQPRNGECLRLIDYTIQVANRLKPDLIVLFIGSNQLSDWLLPGETVANHIGEPAFDQLYTNAATAALRKLAALAIPVLFTTTPVPAWDPVAQTGNPNTPGTGPIKMNDAGRTRRLNELTAAVVRSLPLTVMAPYAERISSPDGTVPSSIRPDGVHLTQAAVPGIMDRGLEADLRTSYLQVVSRVPSAARGGAHHWSKA